MHRCGIEIPRKLAVVVVLSTLTGSVQPADGTPDRYSTLAGHKAQAVFSTNTSQPYIAANEQNKLAAATAAQGACVAANPSPASSGGYCELVRLDDAELTTAAAIKSRLPQRAHPLYLWRYESADATVYLGGSVHILKTGLYPLPRQYQQAFDAAEQLVLEVNLAGLSPQQLQFKAMQYSLLPDDQILSQIMPADIHAQLAATTAEYGLTLDELARFKPAFITQQLAVLALMSVGYDPNQGVETYFVKQAQNKQILELETIDFQFDLLMNQPMDTQVKMAADTLDQMDAFEPFTAALITAWLSGDDSAFQQAFDAQSGSSEESKAFMHQLMDDRNVGMASKIAGYLERPGNYFVLVGAAHCIGENSIIELLARQGIKGQRIYSNQNISQ